ncbi:MAG: hypothetical protein KBS91_01415 [Firmicutes bacterium]|nr:hypothetical protein [Candidatus Caballimonas caccae]
MDISFISSNLMYIPISSALTLISSLTAVVVALSVPLIKGWNKFKHSKMLDAFGEEDKSIITVEDELIIYDKALKSKIEKNDIHKVKKENTKTAKKSA